MDIIFESNSSEIETFVFQDEEIENLGKVTIFKIVKDETQII